MVGYGDFEVKQQVHFCPICFSYATRDTCDVCSDASRDRTTICGSPSQRRLIERTGSYHGLWAPRAWWRHLAHGQDWSRAAPRSRVARALPRARSTQRSPRHQPGCRGRDNRHVPLRHHPPAGRAWCLDLPAGCPLAGDLEYADEVTLAAPSRLAARYSRVEG